MKSKLKKAGFIAVITTLVFACNQKQESGARLSPVNNDSIKRTIQSIEDNFARIYNHRNADSLSYYADDAVSYFVGQQPIVGRAAIHNFIMGELVNFPVGAKITYKTMEVHVSGDAGNVFEIGEFKQIDSTGKILNSGHYFSFFEKRDGKYYCIRDMATPDSPGGN